MCTSRGVAIGFQLIVSHLIHLIRLTTIIVCRLLLELRRSHQSSISRFDTLSNMGNCIIGELGDTERSWTRVGQDLELLQVDAQAAETEPRLD